MIAMTWRQHRLQLLVAAVVLAGAAGYLLFGAWQHASYASQIGLTACLNARPHRDCGLQAEVFFNRFGGIPGPFILLAALPLLAGLFLGAPLLAREAESGTLQLAWTQSVRRTRWLAVKLTTFLAAIGVAAAILSVCFSAWLSVYSQMSFAGYTTVNRMEPPAFDLSGVAPLGAMLFSFALGTLAGVLIRRTVPAMAVALGGYVGAILPLSSVRYTAFFRPAHRQRVLHHGQSGTAGWLHTAVHLQQCGGPPGGVRHPVPRVRPPGRPRAEHDRGLVPGCQGLPHHRVIPARLQVLAAADGHRWHPGGRRRGDACLRSVAGGPAASLGGLARWRAVAVQHPASVRAGRCLCGVGIQPDVPAPSVDRDQVVERAGQDAVGQAREAAFAAGNDVVHVAAAAAGVRSRETRNAGPGARPRGAGARG